MIKTYGNGTAVSVAKNIKHHAKPLETIVMALENGLLASDMARDDDVHLLHLGKGANGINLYLANGEKVAFRGKVTKLTSPQEYGAVELLDAPKEGIEFFTVHNPKQVPAAIKAIEKRAKR